MDDVLRRPLLFAAGVLTGLTAAAYAARTLIPSRGDEMSDDLALVVIANGLELESRAGSFRGGSLAVWMGGAELDLSRATMDAAGAHLELTALMGGIDIRVPRGWRVVARPRGQPGGIALDLDDQQALPADAPLLTIRSLAVGGGIAIRNGWADEPPTTPDA